MINLLFHSANVLSYTPGDFETATLSPTHHQSHSTSPSGSDHVDFDPEEMRNTGMENPLRNSQQ